MIARKPETPEEQWKALADLARDGEAREMAEQPDEEARAEMESRGQNAEAVGERGRAFVEQMLRETGHAREAGEPGAVERVAEAQDPDDREVDAPEPRAPVVRLATRRRVRWTVTLVAAAILVTMGITTAVTLVLRDRETPRPRQDQPAPPLAPERTPNEMAAATLRREADAACAKGDWRACGAKLDDAMRLDPAGDTAPAVEGTRAKVAALKAAEEQKPDAKGDKGPSDKGPH